MRINQPLSFHVMARATWLKQVGLRDTARTGPFGASEGPPLLFRRSFSTHCTPGQAASSSKCWGASSLSPS